MSTNEPKFRVWHIPQIPMDPFTVDVDDLETAVIVQNALADYDLFQFEHRVKPDYANASGIQSWRPEDMDWEDVDEEVIADLAATA